MMKITAVFVLILGLCVSVQGQTRRPDLQAICRRQNDRCLSNQVRNGRSNEVTNIFNNNCRGSIRGWRDVTRCELARANCQLTLLSCSPLTCANVRRTLGTGGPTTPRIPTPRTPSPNPDPDTDTTTRGGRTPRPRTLSPPTRTPRPRTLSPPTRTPRPRRTTTRRTTTRRTRRTTTRRTPRPTAED